MYHIMYRRQRPSSAIPTLIVLGILIGVGFVVYQGWNTPSATPPPTSPPPSATRPPTVMPTRLPTATPMPRASLSIPTAGVIASVVEIYLDGVSWDVTRLGVNAGHLQGTAWIGETGNIVLAGHSEMADGRAGIFRNIGELRTGDPVVLSLGDTQQQYRVTEVKTVKPDDLSVLYPTTTDRITLITCDDYDFLQNTYQERVVVVAERVA